MWPLVKLIVNFTQANSSDENVLDSTQACLKVIILKVILKTVDVSTIYNICLQVSVGGSDSMIEGQLLI